MLTPRVMSYEICSVDAAHAPMAATPRVTATTIFFIDLRIVSSLRIGKVLPRRQRIAAQATVMLRDDKPEYVPEGVPL